MGDPTQWLSSIPSLTPPWEQCLICSVLVPARLWLLVLQALCMLPQLEKEEQPSRGYFSPGQAAHPAQAPGTGVRQSAQLRSCR